MNTKKILLPTLLLMTCNIVLADFPAKLAEIYYPATIHDFHIKIKVPEIAEYNQEVPIVIESLQHPSLNSRTEEVSFYIDNKPNVAVATYKLSPVSIADGLSSRIRIPYGKNTIYAIARLSNGDVIGGQVDIKAVHACNGGG